MSEIITTPPALVRPRDVFKRVALSRTTVYWRVRKGTFPQPVNLGPKRIAWREADIAAWIEAQQPAPRAPEPPAKAKRSVEARA
jgi:prophage regulatory protein